MMPRALAAAAFLVLAAPAFLSAETCPQILRTLQLDDRGSDVAALQTFLSDHGFLPAIAESGYFDADTQTAVQKYQASLGIVSVGSPATTKWGVVGPVTISALSTCKLPAVKAVIPVPVYRTGTPTSNSSVGALAFGMSGSDVTALQQQLISLGLLAPENATGYFGNLTKTAVLQFQAAHGIDQVGSVGPITRGALAEASGGMGSAGAYSPTPPPTQNTSGQGSLFASLLAQISALQERIAQLKSSQGLGTPPPPAPSPSPSYSPPPQITPPPSPTPTPLPPSFSPPAKSSCTFNGQQVNTGASVTAYLGSSVGFGGTCLSQTRTCTDGTLSGSYQYSGCSIGGAASCSLDNTTVAHSAAQTFYNARSVPFGTLCSAVGQNRTCSNGTFSGDPTYQYASCSVGAASSCSFNNQSIANGATVTAYQAASVGYGQTCTSQTRTCANGTLSGTYTNPSCIVGAAQSCTFSNQSLAHGASVTAYQTSSVAFGTSCLSQTRTCSNGTLSGSYIYDTCSANAPSSCTFNGQSISHNETITAYQSASVAYGQQCVSQTRTCSNGTLSGSYTNASCTVGTAASCTFNGQTISNGNSVTAYQSSSVPAGQQCASQTRSCTNGILSGSYTNTSCTVQQPTYTSCGPVNSSGANHEIGFNYTLAFRVFSGDTNSNPSQSPVVILENGLPLGPAHSGHQTIRDFGAGRFSHWYDALYFSASDNSNPATNGRSYTYGVPTGTSCPGTYTICGTVDLSSANYETGYNYVAQLPVSGGDTTSNSSQSPVLIFENGLPLGPAHSLHQTIRDQGGGKYSHWYGELYFSASDNSNPKTNGRNYAYGVPAGTSCPSTQSASCTFNGQTIANGASVAAYQASSVPAGQQCVSQSRTCSNGTLSGTYQYASCTVGTAASCTFNGQTVSSGASVTAYQSSSVPSGQTCVQETRACTNGTLSGSYAYTTCTVSQPGVPAAPTNLTASCTPQGSDMTATLNWTPVSGATSYIIRADDLYTSETPCTTNNGLDICTGPVTGIPPYTFAANQSRSYKAWVHAVNAVGYGPETYVNFACGKVPFPIVDIASITNLSPWAQYSPPSINIPARQLDITAEYGTYQGWYQGTMKYSGTNLMNDVLQPSLDFIGSLGGGVVHMNKFAGGIYSLNGNRQTTGSNTVELHNNTALVGDTNADGSPATIISIDSDFGNVFGGQQVSNIAMANLEVQSHNRGYYTFSNNNVQNSLIRNVRVYDPKDAAFGHFAGVNNWYVDDRVYEVNTDTPGDLTANGGHGFSFGGNQLLTDPLGHQDSGSTVINGYATGYNTGTGQGLLVRCASGYTGADIAHPNINLRVIGGEYTGNTTGVQICDSPNALVRGVNSHDNSQYNFLSTGITNIVSQSTTPNANIANALTALQAALQTLLQLFK